MGRSRVMPWEEPHIGIFFGGEGDPDCFQGPFFRVELVGEELHGYRTVPCDITKPEVIARRSQLGEAWGWAAVESDGETNDMDWFQDIHVVMVCGKKTKNGFCQNPLESEDCEHPVMRGGR